MDSDRKTALVVGVLFIVTFITSIPALFLYQPVTDHANYVLGAGADSRIFVGAFLEVLLAISDIGTAVAFFPVLKRYNEGLALGYVAARVVEAAITLVGVIGLLSVVTLRRDFTGADASTFVIVGKALVAIHKWTFLIGPGFCPAIENGLLLGYLMYRTGLMPRGMAVLGLVGGSLAFVAGTLELFSVIQQTAPTAGLLTLLEAAWEALIGIYLTVRGFRPSPIIAGTARHVGAGEPSAAPVPTAA